MTIDDAKKAGAHAFLAGLGRAPALNSKFTAAACEAAREGAGPSLVELLGAYGTGWTIAQLAEHPPIPDMPSVIEFKRLMG